MDERIKKLSTPEACARFARNAEDHGRPDLAKAANRRAVELASEKHGAKTEAEKECLQAIYAYERTLEARHGKAVRANYTWRAIREHGIIPAVERAVTKPQETAGFKSLQDMGLQDLAFEAVILRYPELFSKEALLRSRARLSEWKEPVEETPETAKQKLFTVIQDPERIKSAQSRFETRVRDVATAHRVVTLGYQGGGGEVDAFHIGPLEFWVAFSDLENRYWNALGIGVPWGEGSTIIAEINPPKSGIDRNIGGLFIEDAQGAVYLAHRGKVGGGHKGIGKENFLDWYRGSMDLVYDGDRTIRAIVIGGLEDANLIDNLAKFTKSVAAFKDDAVRVTWRRD